MFTFHRLTSAGVSASSYFRCTPRNLLKISTGCDTFQPLNCHAAPWAKTAITRRQSDSESRCGLSTTLKVWIEPSGIVREIFTASSFLAPCLRFSWGVAKVDRSSRSAALRMVIKDVMADGTMMTPTASTRVLGFFGSAGVSGLPSALRFSPRFSRSFSRASWRLARSFSSAWRAMKRSYNWTAKEKSLPGQRQRPSSSEPME
mmetsp:Transcript_28794/g.86018  ORF Transcript_28794/g.86018 Transcript_28794/m.86018 type:complete len:203 (+) Transcript_28794:182-790(+)